MKSKLQNFHFLSWTETGYQQFLSQRKGEIRLGERLVDVKKAKFIVLGIEESIGPKANLGNGGAENGFKSFCAKFLNMQSTNSLVGESIAFLGAIQSIGVVDSSLKNRVEELDDFVCDVLISSTSPDQVLIVIGGGHNNAFPIIKSRCNVLESKLNVVNLDAHADYRALEGRHSGNPFSYACNDGYLEKYFVLGLHERYNNEATMKGLEKDNHFFSFFEKYIDDFELFKSDLDYVSKGLIFANLPFGIELDMDAIEGMPSSAISPSGFCMSDARYYIRKMVRNENCCYLHLPEAAPINDKETLLVGKALSYLVSDFISCHPFSNSQRLSN